MKGFWKPTSVHIEQRPMCKWEGNIGGLGEDEENNRYALLHKQSLNDY